MINRLNIWTVKSIFVVCFVLMMSQWAVGQTSSGVPESITTPDQVETSIGTLEFWDGVPSEETAQKVYDNLDFTRALTRSTIVLRLAYAIREGFLSIG